MFWTILSWIFVILLTSVNIFIFMKLKKAAEQVMQMAMPGKNMGNLSQMMAQVQKMMQGQGGNSGFDAQMKTAMQLFQQIQKKK